jgi:riboflavin kinase / FMN adenylyltransferase
MQVFYNTNDAAGKLTNTVVTTGSFDGVHIGHKIIIDRLKEIARDIDGESVLVTFHPHPRKVLYPEEKDLKLINTQEEKIELLSKTGLHNLVIIPFSLEFSKTTSHDFITDILIGQLSARVIVVGHNHHFGHNRSGDFGYLYDLSNQLGFQVEDIPLKDIENETVSSTKIRKALMEGNIMRANAYLDHQYIISGILSKPGELPGMNSTGAFRVLIPEAEKLVPPPGIYATNIVTEGGFIKSMTLVHEDGEGNRMVDNMPVYGEKGLEGTKGTIYFYKKIRGREVFMDNLPIQSEILEAKEEVEELIY